MSLPPVPSPPLYEELAAENAQLKLEDFPEPMEPLLSGDHCCYGG